MPIPLSTKYCCFDSWSPGTLLEKTPLRLSPNRIIPMTPEEAEVAVVISQHSTTTGGYVTVLIVESQNRQYFKTTIDVSGSSRWTTMTTNNEDA